MSDFLCAAAQQHLQKTVDELREHGFLVEISTDNKVNVVSVDWAARQPGSPAARQPGSPAARQPVGVTRRASRRPPRP